MSINTHLLKILGVTTDNTSNNDTMITQLSAQLDDFPGASNQTRCFLHILNLTAKAIISQFDIPKAKNGVVMDQAAQALASLAEGLDLEEQDAYGDQLEELEDDEADDKPLDRWVDPRDGLTDEERKQIDLNIRPVQTTLTKVRVAFLSCRVETDSVKLCKFAHAVKKSTTILIPQWYKTLSSCHLPCHMMPHDVSTRWNSTYDMLLFALDFHPAINSMTAMCDLDPWKFELSPAEWGIAEELRDVLKVSFQSLSILVY